MQLCLYPRRNLTGRLPACGFTVHIYLYVKRCAVPQIRLASSSQKMKCSQTQMRRSQTGDDGAIACVLVNWFLKALNPQQQFGGGVVWGNEVLDILLSGWKKVVIILKTIVFSRWEPRWLSLVLKYTVGYWLIQFRPRQLQGGAS